MERRNRRVDCKLSGQTSGCFTGIHKTEESKPLSCGRTRERGQEAIHTKLQRVRKAEPQKQDVLPGVDVTQRNIKNGSEATPFLFSASELPEPAILLQNIRVSGTPNFENRIRSNQHRPCSSQPSRSGSGSALPGQENARKSCLGPGHHLPLDKNIFLF
jgi:hypothetical protein